MTFLRPDVEDNGDASKGKNDGNADSGLEVKFVPKLAGAIAYGLHHGRRQVTHFLMGFFSIRT
jgi:hypothetical protein